MNAAFAVVALWLSLIPGPFTGPKVQSLKLDFPPEGSISQQMSEIQNQMKACNPSL